MQRFAQRILAVVVTFAAVPVVAGTIGFLDTERVIKTVKEGQRQVAALNEWANKKSDEVEAMRDRVAELTEQLESQRNVASADVIARLEKDLLQAQRDFEDAARTLRADFENKQTELLAEVATRVSSVASEYAAANGFEAVFTLGAQPLIYIRESAMITDAVIQRYNELYPGD